MLLVVSIFRHVYKNTNIQYRFGDKYSFSFWFMHVRKSLFSMFYRWMYGDWWASWQFFSLDFWHVNTSKVDIIGPDLDQVSFLHFSFFLTLITALLLSCRRLESGASRRSTSLLSRECWRRPLLTASRYWVPQKFPQIYTVIAYIFIGKVAWFAVYICGNVWNALYEA